MYPWIECCEVGTCHPPIAWAVSHVGSPTFISNRKQTNVHATIKHRIQNNTKHSENGEIHLFQGWKLTRARVSFIRFLCVWGAYFKAYSRGRHWNPTVFTCPPKHGERHRPRKASAMRYPAPNKTHTRIKNPVFYTSFWPHPLEISYASFWLKLKISKSGNANALRPVSLHVTSLSARFWGFHTVYF